jgi:hypothetical protein
MTYIIPSYTVQPGSVYQPKTSGPAYILDQIGGVIGCWSTRQLMAAGSGDIIRGRDSTTNEADYTSASYPSGIVTLANGGDAFCPAVYDQSGNVNHATQTTAANQPKLVDAGSLIVDASGRPSMDFSGITGYLNLTSLLALSSDFFINCYLKINTSQALHFLDYTSGDARLFFQSSSQLIYRVNGTNYIFNLDSSLVIGNWYNIALNRVSNTVTIYVNSIPQAVTHSISDTININRLGKNAASFIGEIQSVVILSKSLTQSEITQVHNAMV